MLPYGNYSLETEILVLDDREIWVRRRDLRVNRKNSTEKPSYSVYQRSVHYNESPVIIINGKYEVDFFKKIYRATLLLSIHYHPRLTYRKWN